MAEKTYEGSIYVFEFFLVNLSKPTSQNWTLEITTGYFQIPIKNVNAVVNIEDGVDLGEGYVVQEHAGIYKWDQATISCYGEFDADIYEEGDQNVWLAVLGGRVAVYKTVQLPATLGKHYSWVIRCCVPSKHYIFNPKLASC